jgi:hypothetical protein
LERKLAAAQQQQQQLEVQQQQQVHHHHQQPRMLLLGLAAAAVAALSSCSRHHPNFYASYGRAACARHPCRLTPAMLLQMGMRCSFSHCSSSSRQPQHLQMNQPSLQVRLQVHLGV